MTRELDRRRFIKTTLAGTTVASLATDLAVASDQQPFDPKDLPTRPFGKVGIRVPLLGFGTGGRWLSNKDDDDALGLLEYALSNDVFSLAVVSMNSLEQVKKNLRVVRNFRPLSQERIREMRSSLDAFYRGVRVAWMKPDYVDGGLRGV